MGKPLTIKWAADIKDVLTKTDKMSGKLAGFGSKLKTGMKVGAAAAGVAMVGFAASGVKAFGDLEKGLNEVRTLLPDMGQKEFEGLRKQVLSFSKEMGVSTTQVVPALYQAISAGVPQENVFDFMKVASKASIGGVTDLETAVDGISTVVNGYGAENMSAQRAADLMFNTVKLGKTDFEKLSRTLANVTPMASALGVGFDEVSAAMAVMTSQGMKTGVATTSIRAALAELGKEGSIADVAFQDITGKSFPKFIRDGGTMGEALSRMADHAARNGTELQNMFGSVEAGTGVLAILADDGKSYESALDAMANSAGSVDTAFETMDSGMNRSSERLGVQFENLKIQLGELFAPMLTSVLEAAGPAVEKVSGWFAEDGPVRNAFSKTKEAAGGIWDKIAEDGGVWDKIAPAFAWVGPMLTALGDSIKGLFEEGGGLHSMGEALKEWWPLALKFWKFLGYIQIGISAIVLALWPLVRGPLMAAIQVFSGVFNQIAGWIKIIVGLLTGDFAGAWEGVKDVVRGAIQVLTAPLTSLRESWKGLLSGLIGKLLGKIGDLASKAGSALLDGLLWIVTDGPGKLWEAIKAILPTWDQMWEAAKTIGEAILDGVLWLATDGPTKLFDAIKGILPSWDDIWEAAKSIGEAILDSIKIMIEQGPGIILDAIKSIIPSAGDILGGIASGITGAASKVTGLVPHAEGGIVTQPTAALIGEAGPEAVVPLSGAAGRKWRDQFGGGSIVVNIEGDVYSGPDAFADKVISALRRQERVHGQIADFSAV